MTLSQILARDSYYDEKTEIPSKGQWVVRVLIRDGKILNAWKEESIKKPGKLEAVTYGPHGEEWQRVPVEEKIKK